MDEFINKYDGQQVADPWGNYLGECVSLWKRYAQEIQGVNPSDLYVPGGAAKNIWLQFTLQMARYYTKETDPQAGDAAIYDGNYGDVAIVVSPTQVFGQLGTPVFKPAAIRNIGSPLGFIRLKGEFMDKDQATKLALFLRLAAGESVDQANGAADYDVNHILADPGYAAALAEQIYHGNENFRYKASHYDADITAAKQPPSDPSVTVTQSGLWAAFKKFLGL